MTTLDKIQQFKTKIEEEIEDIASKLSNEACSKPKTEEDTTPIEKDSDKLAADKKDIKEKAPCDEEGNINWESLMKSGVVTEGSKEEYQKFFQAKLKKFGAKSPSSLSDSDKKKFFNEIEKEWTKDSD